MDIERLPWWPELIARKDDLDLRQLAAQFGTTAGAIAAAFRRWNISRRVVAAAVPERDELPEEKGAEAVVAALPAADAAPELPMRVWRVSAPGARPLFVCADSFAVALACAGPDAREVACVGELVGR